MYFLEVDCSQFSDILGFVKGIIDLIKIAVPILLIIMGMLDLGKAVVAGKDDEIKKAQSTLVKRAIAAVAVFFVITIVQLLFGLLGNTGDGALKCLDYIK
jgi:surface polysaccharide O-acyltransferase-like enzyme